MLQLQKTFRIMPILQKEIHTCFLNQSEIFLYYQKTFFSDLIDPKILSQYFSTTLHFLVVMTMSIYTMRSSVGLYLPLCRYTHSTRMVHALFTQRWWFVALWEMWTGAGFGSTEGNRSIRFQYFWRNVI